MVQHVGLMMLISPLLILGSPVRLLLNSRFALIKRSARLFSQITVIRWLFIPQVGFVIFVSTLIGTHFSPLANAGMNDANAMSFELILFLVAGLIYYLPVLEGNPTPYPVSHAVRVISLFAMMLPETMTGFFLYSGNKLLHTAHLTAMDMPGMDMRGSSTLLDPLTDQHIGGALMWSMGMIIDSVWIALAVRDFFVSEAKKSEANV